jgi:hypothetical protein
MAEMVSFFEQLRETTLAQTLPRLAAHNNLALWSTWCVSDDMRFRKASIETEAEG